MNNQRHQYPLKSSYEDISLLFLLYFLKVTYILGMKCCNFCMPEERAFNLCDGHYATKCSKEIILNNLTFKKEEMLTGILNKNISYYPMAQSRPMMLLFSSAYSCNQFTIHLCQFTSLPFSGNVPEYDTHVNIPREILEYYPNITGWNMPGLI